MLCDGGGEFGGGKRMRVFIASVFIMENRAA